MPCVIPCLLRDVDLPLHSILKGMLRVSWYDISSFNTTWFGLFISRELYLTNGLHSSKTNILPFFWCLGGSRECCLKHCSKISQSSDFEDHGIPFTSHSPSSNHSVSPRTSWMGGGFILENKKRLPEDKDI